MIKGDNNGWYGHHPHTLTDDRAASQEQTRHRMWQLELQTQKKGQIVMQAFHVYDEPPDSSTPAVNHWSRDTEWIMRYHCSGHRCIIIWLGHSHASCFVYFRSLKIFCYFFRVKPWLHNNKNWSVDTKIKSGVGKWFDVRQMRTISVMSFDAMSFKQNGEVLTSKAQRCTHCDIDLTQLVAEATCCWSVLCYDVQRLLYTEWSLHHVTGTAGTWSRWECVGMSMSGMPSLWLDGAGLSTLESLSFIESTKLSQSSSSVAPSSPMNLMHFFFRLKRKGKLVYHIERHIEQLWPNALAVRDNRIKGCTLWCWKQCKTCEIGK